MVINVRLEIGSLTIKNTIHNDKAAHSNQKFSFKLPETPEPNMFSNGFVAGTHNFKDIIKTGFGR